MARDITHRGHMVTVNVNNHYEGSAPLTIEAMQSMLQALKDEKDSKMPPARIF